MPIFCSLKVRAKCMFYVLINKQKKIKKYSLVVDKNAVVILRLQFDT